MPPTSVDRLYGHSSGGVVNALAVASAAIALFGLAPTVAFSQLATSNRVGGPRPLNSAFARNPSLSSPQTPAESGAGATIVSAAYAPGNVMRYGADPTGVVDSRTALQTALNVARHGGPAVFVPEGRYKCSGNLIIFQNTILYGVGWQRSIIDFTNTGDGVDSGWPINSSTAANVTVRELSLMNSSGGNSGGGFVDAGGSFVKVRDSYFSGWRFGVIFDQSEISDITGNIFQGYTGAGVWLVNGADHTPAVTFNSLVVQGATGGTLTAPWTGATGQYNLNFVERIGGASESRAVVLTAGSTAVTWSQGLTKSCNAATTGARQNYTNRITADRNQFNTNGANAIGLQDDGGVSHTITNNNFNGGLYGMRLAGVFGLDLGGNYSEATRRTDLWLTNTTVSGAGIAIPGCSGIAVYANVLGSAGVTRNVQLDAADGGFVKGNFLAQGISGISLGGNVAGVEIANNSRLITGPYRTGGAIVNGTSPELRQNMVTQAASTYVATPIDATGSRTVTPADMTGIMPGSRLLCRNADNSNTEFVTVTSTTGTTFTATFTSTKASNWLVVGSTPGDQQEGTYTPVLSGATTAGNNRYAATTAGNWQRRGNLVVVNFGIDVSAVDESMSGALQISLPFPGVNQANENAQAAVSFFTGFTFAAGYGQMGGIVFPNSKVITLRKSGSGVAATTVAKTDIAGSACSVYGTVTYHAGAL